MRAILALFALPLTISALAFGGIAEAGDKSGNVESPVAEFDTGFRGKRTVVAVTGDGKTLLSISSSKSANVQVWDVAKRVRIREFDAPRPKLALAMSRNGKFAAFSDASGPIVYRMADGHTLKFKGNEIDSGAESFFPFCAQFSRSGDTLFLLDNRRIMAIDPTTTRKKTEWIVPLGDGSGTALSSLSNTFDKDRKIAAGDSEGNIRIWDTARGKELQKLVAAKKDRIFAIAVTQDGKTLLSLSIDGSAHVWDLPKGVVRRVIDDAADYGCLLLAPDDRSFLYPATGDDIHLQDIDSGKTLRVFRGHTASVWSMAASADWSRFFSSGNDTTIKMWNLKSTR